MVHCGTVDNVEKSVTERSQREIVSPLEPTIVLKIAVRVHPCQPPNPSGLRGAP